MTPNFSLYPPEGYVYDDPAGVQLKADNWPGLIQRTRAFRESRGLPIGDPAREIFDQFCSRHPRYCGDQRAAQAFKELAETDDGFVGRVEASTAAMFTALNQRKLRYTDAGTAERRIHICLHCPRQRNAKPSCIGCHKNLKSVEDHMLQNRPNSHGLFGCGILAENTKISTQLNLPPVTGVTLPDHCWRK